MKTHPLRPSQRLLQIYRAAILLAMIAYMLYRPNIREMSTIPFVILLMALFILALLFWYYRVVVRIKQQALNSALAYTSLTDTQYFIYLRSFRTAGQMPIKNLYGGWMERSLMGKYLDIEFILTTSVAQEGLLVAIGDKTETVGAAKVIVSDDEWKTRFVDLCSRAKAIFVLPDASESLIWEMKQIINSPALLSRAFFLMPPPRGMIRSFGLAGYLLGSTFRHTGRWWRQTQEELGKEGLFVPDFCWEGSIFRMSEQGKSSLIHSFDWLQSGHLTKALVEPDESNVTITEPWFDRWPVTWTIFTPGAFLPSLVTLICSLLFASFLFAPFNSPSASMMNTLLVGDYFFVSKYSYGYSQYSGLLPSFTGRIFAHEPSRGDVVVFRLPKDNSTDYIKRVIGLPGDHIQMIDGLLHINGNPVKRERIADFIDDNFGSRSIKRWRETLPNGVSYDTLSLQDNGFLDNTQVYKVPPGHYFMIGDHRNNSVDSRVLSQVGYVPFENLVGRAQIVFFSIGDGESPWHIWSWPWSVRWDRFFHLIK